MEFFPAWLRVEPFLLAGLALWTSLAAVNNARAFGHGTAYIGFIMGMGGLRIEGVPDSPLMGRAVKHSAAHRLVLFMIILLECATAIALWAAALLFFMSTPPIDPSLAAFFAVCLFMGLGFTLLVGGSWFAYYAHMEQAQITHFLMIALSVLVLCLLRLGT
ncbi:MAG: DUF2165 family protein [Roseibium sp.]|nr:DUF2165 family protein [Roseibium sp.]